MKPSEEVVGEAVRVEYSEQDGRLFLVFEITNPQHKHRIRQNWTDDIEFKLVDRKLISETNE